MEAVSSQPVSLNILRAHARAGDRTCAKGPKDRSKSVSAKRSSRSSTHSLFKRALRSEIAQRGCVGPDATPHDLGDNPIRSEFNTTLENGQRTKLEETFYFDHDGDGGQTTPDLAKSTTYDWVYDANDRLVSETIDHHDDALDHTESFVMDLFGNRTARTIDYVDPTAVDQAFAYSYDDNDRLVNETLDNGADSTVDTTTRYSWDHTQQTGKEIFTGDSTAPANLVSSQSFSYDLQGRLAEVITTPETGPATKVTYSYDSFGIRVSSSQFTDANDNGIFETSELDHTIEYLVDHRNHTGYAQTIVEVTKDSSGQITKRIAYTFGTDEITQTVTDYVAGITQTPEVHTFGHDAHGSVRILLDTLGEIAQTFTYAAYGELLVIYNATGTLVGTLGAADTSAALTSLLYSGESFDSSIGQQYLRARWYEATAARFSRLDPYFGNLNDPLSFNKYLYAHSTPTNAADPSGNFIAATVGLIGAFAAGRFAEQKYNKRVISIGAGVAGFISGYLAVKFGAISVWGRYNALWGHATVLSRPGLDEHAPKQVWIENIENVLNSKVDEYRTLSHQQRTEARLGSRRIAEAYVDSVQAHLVDHFGLEVNSATDFGAGGDSPGWFANAFGGPKKCWYWATKIAGDIRSRLSRPGSLQSGWRLRNHRNVPQAGDVSLGVLFPHSFTSLTFSPDSEPISQREPDFVIDPWKAGRPDLFAADEFTKLWPIDSGEEW